MKKLSRLMAIVVIASWSVVNAQEPQEPSISLQAADSREAIQRKGVHVTAQA